MIEKEPRPYWNKFMTLGNFPVPISGNVVSSVLVIILADVVDFAFHAVIQYGWRIHSPWEDEAISD